MSCGKFVIKEFKGTLEILKELEVPCHVVNSSFQELKGISGNFKELRDWKSHVMW